MSWNAYNQGDMSGNATSSVMSNLFENAGVSTGTSSLSMAGYGAIGSAIGAIGSAYAQAQSFKIQQYQAQVKAAQARLQGKVVAMELGAKFNKTMASNMVMSAAQGRRGGSVEAVASAAEAKFNWDVDFAAASAKIQQGGYQSLSSQYGSASTQSLIGGSLGGIVSAGQKYYQSKTLIGG